MNQEFRMSETKTKDAAVQNSNNNTQQEESNSVITMRQLLECGVHFGHQTKRWNPKMKPYIFTSRNGIHVIDLQQTIKLIHDVFELVKEIARRGGTVLFVGTKKQAQEAIQIEAERSSMPYVNHRWLGGTLTNNMTIRQSINKMKKYTGMKDNGLLQKLSNKESSRITKRLAKLEYSLTGIKNMVSMPSILFVIDTKREQLAIKEAHKLGIPIIGIVDTNADPNEVQYPIPANDDAIRAIRLLCSIISRAVLEGRGAQEAAGFEKVEEQMLQASQAKATEEPKKVAE